MSSELKLISDYFDNLTGLQKWSFLFDISTSRKNVFFQFWNKPCFSGSLETLKFWVFNFLVDGMKYFLLIHRSPDRTISTISRKNEDSEKKDHLFPSRDTVVFVFHCSRNFAPVSKWVSRCVKTESKLWWGVSTIHPQNAKLICRPWNTTTFRKSKLINQQFC